MDKDFCISFCGGGGESCGSIANRLNDKSNTIQDRFLFNITSDYNQRASRPYVSQQFSNAFDFGALGLIKNMAR